MFKSLIQICDTLKPTVTKSKEEELSEEEEEVVHRIVYFDDIISDGKSSFYR